MADSALQLIDKRAVATGILYNRVYPFAGLDRFNSNSLDTSNYDHFIQSFSEISRASYKKQELTVDVEVLRSRIDSMLNTKNSIVPIGIILYRFNAIDSLAVKKGVVSMVNERLMPTRSDVSKLFITKEVLVAIPLTSEYRGTKIVYKISPDWVFSNIDRKGSNLSIDFADGKGFRKVNITKEQQVEINYPSGGDKVIKFRVSYGNNKTVTSNATITITAAVSLTCYIPNWPIDPKSQFFAQIPFTDYSGNSFKGKGEVTYIYSNADKKLRKPLIVVDGFDPSDTRNDFGDGNVNGKPRTESIFRIFNEPINLADQLLSRGYDIVILNFPTYPNQYNTTIDGGADFIERNAMVLVELINQVNAKLQQNGSTEKLVVVGPSMGGQISRYALAYMEKNSMNHNTRLWVSFDSPHQGANITQGAQAFLWFFGFFGGNEGASYNYNKKICSNAAKQMLIKHYDSQNQNTENSYRTQYKASLAQIGFPSNLRKIAVMNGSMNGVLNQSSCQKAFHMRARRVLGYDMAYGDIWLSSGYGGQCNLFKGRVPILGPLGIPSYFINWDYSRSSDGYTCSYDVAPGGTYKTIYYIWEQSHTDPNLVECDKYFNSHSFIPTKSALAFTGNNQDLAENLSGRNLVGTGETPFQSYWGPINKNMEHITFDTDMAFYLMNEINGVAMPPNMGEYIAAPSSVCPSATFSLLSIPSGTPITWSYSANLTYLGGQGTAQLTVTPAYPSVGGMGWVEATLNGAYGSAKIRKDFWVGVPSIPLDIIGFSYNGKHFGSNSYYDFHVNAPLNQGTSLYEWVVGGGAIEEGQGTGLITALTCDAGDMDKYFDVSVRVGNACGWSPWLWRTGYVDGGVGPAYIVSPNPASSVITISTLDNAKSDQTISQLEPIKRIRVFDKMGLPIMTQEYSGKDNSVTLNISSLPKGVFIIKINDKESHTIIKE